MPYSHEPIDDYTDPDEIDQLDDAIVEDTVHCQLCGGSWVLGTRGDGVILTKLAGDDVPYQIASGQLLLCIDCAFFAARTLDQLIAESDQCEHGVLMGEWCEPCNESYRSARLDPESGNGDALDALEESVKLQSHYAELLNMHDGGERRGFRSAKAWIVAK